MIIDMFRLVLLIVHRHAHAYDGGGAETEEDCEGTISDEA